MPQMKPLLWLNLYVYFLISLILVIFCLYFLHFFKVPFQKDVKLNKNNFVWVW
uniref:ATP synthase complex subunit 8 n=1 Tax=Ceratosolen solmsi TaxID=142686 RepID=D1FKB8_9HYME|nr:ATP synthase subunit 8 [Ceratosolen solmsi]